MNTNVDIKSVLRTDKIFFYNIDFADYSDLVQFSYSFANVIKMYYLTNFEFVKLQSALTDKYM